MVFKFTRNEPLEEASTVDVLVKPTYRAGQPLPDWLSSPEPARRWVARARGPFPHAPTGRPFMEGFQGHEGRPWTVQISATSIEPVSP